MNQLNEEQFEDTIQGSLKALRFGLRGGSLTGSKPEELRMLPNLVMNSESRS